MKKNDLNDAWMRQHGMGGISIPKRSSFKLSEYTFEYIVILCIIVTLIVGGLNVIDIIKNPYIHVAIETETESGTDVVCYVRQSDLIEYETGSTFELECYTVEMRESRNYYALSYIIDTSTIKGVKHLD